jgi:AcrR family transcriptional regulator
VRTHGWGGDPPATDDEAIERILAATRRCIDNEGTGTSIVGVAHALGVTRQTVYRYFASTEDLLTATAINAAGGFLDRLAAHVAPLDDPADAVVEAIAFTLEQLMCEPYLNLLLTSGRVSTFALGVTSEIAIVFGRSIIERFSVNWTEAGFDDQLLTELVEHVLRTIQSLALYPVHPERDGAAQRRYLTRWVAPAVQHMAALHR